MQLTLYNVQLFHCMFLQCGLLQFNRDKLAVVIICLHNFCRLHNRCGTGISSVICLAVRLWYLYSIELANYKWQMFETTNQQWFVSRLCPMLFHHSGRNFGCHSNRLKTFYITVYMYYSVYCTKYKEACTVMHSLYALNRAWNGFYSSFKILPISLLSCRL